MATTGAVLEPRMPTAGKAARRLTQQERQDYAASGYLKNLPLFDATGVAALQQRFDELLARVPAGVDINSLNNWHKGNRWCYELCHTPAILDYVEDLLGPNFVQWGCQFFCKLPGATSEVPWHQDAQYWPLAPSQSVTMWIAFYDSNTGNGAMQVVAGSHRGQRFVHHQVEGEQYSLQQAIDASQFDAADVATMNLRAGEISLHDDGLVHGSGASTSGKRRVGMTLRFSPTNVRCDLGVWPTFESYLMRGRDTFMHNPIGKVPGGDSLPTGRFQASHEFE
jgi:non-heme Fe2+,alpha-ketoglutarate-dependent halogenase